MVSNRVDSATLIAGGLLGVIAWAIGYATTYVVVAPAVRDSPLNRIIEAFNGAPATYEMVGWVFYNAHFAPTVFRDVPLLGRHTMSFIGGEDGFTVLMYAIPVVILIGIGGGFALYHRVPDPAAGVLVGGTLVPGYLVMSIAGVFLFEVTVGSASGAPDLLPGVFLSGIVWPAFFGGGAGAAGGLLRTR